MQRFKICDLIDSILKVSRLYVTGIKIEKKIIAEIH